MTVDELIIELYSRGIAASRIKGCSPEELLHVEAQVGRQLPAMYKEFLQKLGHGAGDFGEDLEVYYEHVTDILKSQSSRRMRANEHLDRFGPGSRLTKSSFIFATIHGRGEYSCFFNLDDERDDPPVYGVGEALTSIEVTAWSFTEMLVTYLEYIE